MRYVSIQQTIRYSICKISDIDCGPQFWTVFNPESLLDNYHVNHSIEVNFSHKNPVILENGITFLENGKFGSLYIVREHRVTGV